MKPDFDTMSLAELRAYLLSHRNDDEAFYKLADRLEASAENTNLYPLPETPETIAIMEAAIQEHIKTLEEKKNGQAIVALALLDGIILDVKVLRG